jgi:hypothetical protein
MLDRDEVIIPHGKHIAYSDTLGGSYTNVDGTVDVNLPERELGASEITNDDSPDFHKDYIPGMYEPGTVGFTYRYNKTGFAALETIFQLASATGTRASATKYWKVTIPDGGSTAIFRGFMTAHTLPMEGDEDSPIVEVELQVNGKIAYAAAS